MKNNNKTSMLHKESWQKFRNTGLLWWINGILHTFGWVLAMEFDDDGTLTNVYPARTRFRGFSEEINDGGYRNITKYMKDNAEQLYKEIQD